MLKVEVELSLPSLGFHRFFLLLFLKCNYLLFICTILFSMVCAEHIFCKMRFIIYLSFFHLIFHIYSISYSKS